MLKNVPDRLKRVFCGRNGLRPGWRMAAGAAVYLAVLYGTIAGLGAAFGALFDAWGLTTSNLAYAPGWAQFIVLLHTDFTYVLAYLLSALAGLAAAKRLCCGTAVRPDRKTTVAAALAGLGLAVGLTIAALATDCVRMERPAAEPYLSVMQPVAVLMIALGKFSGDVLTKRLALDAFGRRKTGVILSVAVSLLLMGNWTCVPGAVNTALFALAGCALYVRGGLAASAALSAAWSAWTTLAFGFPGTATSVGAVYPLYHVSDGWLTGGGLGPDCGLWLTLGLLLLLGWMLRREAASALGRFAHRFSGKSAPEPAPFRSGKRSRRNSQPENR